MFQYIGCVRQFAAGQLPCPPGLDAPSDDSTSVTIADSDDDTATTTTSDELATKGSFGYSNRWHETARCMGVVSGDGHVFTNTARPDKLSRSRGGEALKLSSLCMVFDDTLRRGGQHQYNYAILGGELGPADGVGFVFDSKIRRNNIQCMRSVFLNRRGQLCVRDRESVTKLRVRLPELAQGVIVVLFVDLDSLVLRFMVRFPDGSMGGSADVSAAGLFGSHGEQCCGGSGFFCAVVTKDVTVALT